MIKWLLYNELQKQEVTHPRQITEHWHVAESWFRESLMCMSSCTSVLGQLSPFTEHLWPRAWTRTENSKMMRRLPLIPAGGCRFGKNHFFTCCKFLIKLGVCIISQGGSLTAWFKESYSFYFSDSCWPYKITLKFACRISNFCNSILYLIKI